MPSRRTRSQVVSAIWITPAARAVLTDALTLETDASAAYLARAHAHALLGDAEAARRDLVHAGERPASDPRLVVAVMIDEPSAGQYYGGSVAAPVFSAVTGSALRMLGVPTDAPVNNVVLPPEGAEIGEET